MADRKVRIKKVISDNEEIIDFNDGVRQAVDFLSNKIDKPFGYAVVDVTNNISALLGNTYVCRPGDANTVVITLEKANIGKVGQNILVQNDDAYGSGSFVKVVPADDSKTINYDGYLTLAEGESSWFILKEDGNWIAAKFSKFLPALVKVSSDDTTEDFLVNKIVAGDNINVSVKYPSRAEELEISLGAHAYTHVSGGADSFKLDDVGEPDDNTDLDSSTLRHGLLPKLSNDGYEYLDGLGDWSSPVWQSTTGWAFIKAGENTFIETELEDPVAFRLDESNSYYEVPPWDYYSDGYYMDSDGYTITAKTYGTYYTILSTHITISAIGASCSELGHIIIYKNGTRIPETKYKIPCLYPGKHRIVIRHYEECDPGDYFEAYGYWPYCGNCWSRAMAFDYICFAAHRIGPKEN